MEHLAIMNPKWRLIDKILAKEKTVESRWYINKVAPWGKISSGEIIYFKDAGKPVVAKAIAENVLQIELTDLDSAIALVKEYQERLCFTKDSLENFNWLAKKRYAILIFLSEPIAIPAFKVDKTGYGSACAWICTNSIDELKL